MSLKHSIAAKKRWDSLSPEEKKQRTAKASAKRWAHVDSKDRKRHGKMMVSKRDGIVY